MKSKLSMEATKRGQLFACTICNKPASTKKTAERHFLIVHSGEKPFQCAKCPKLFALKFMKENHEKIHNPQLVKCEICFKEVRTSSINLHKELIHGMIKGYGKTTCSICRKGVKDMTRHLKTHQTKMKMPNPMEMCPICKKQYSFQKGNNMAKHMAKHSMIKKYQCKQCESFYSTKSVLKAHMRSHTGEKPFRCKYCSMDFIDLSNRNAHEISHENGNSVFQERDLSNHTTVAKFQCHVCRKNYSKKDRLEIHIRSHTGEKPFVCEVCPISFVRRDSRIAHERKHIREKTFECETCPRKFDAKSSLKRHISLLHLNVKPYSCEICQKSYTLKHQLKVHKELHDGQVYPCKQCSQICKTKTYLAHHERNYHNSKIEKGPSRCNICQKLLSSSLKRHNLLAHSKNRPFSCKVCYRTFALEWMMNTHIKEDHLK